ncbi:MULTISPECIES: dsDNA nuclease domain-containing protein [Brevibacillus]|uniref:dsDNA nuclease domain-containing protein n=1 Tax=Brevibacillus TaxID=55080 RepID=UPI000D10C750|nr:MULTISPECIES: dsDNA nuclease domain-containing protein [Brevibacillus]MCE0453030.1 DUF4297 domain-containing protein [Brevibacillus sp. AF8]MED1948706.1 dsDNA nuclease domain-containing protein [Brevibacillus formosus]MED2000405.1 dsDNA nuclease domain-containing protein [Brevibacillus formosus]MED2085573.1 dsDNA nuclease domain-containing protein [Brevibacillus formosus]PSK16309.1 hypothetical protein C7R94_17465 [Brevibacillus sp. NRRL NRS-603]
MSQELLIFKKNTDAPGTSRGFVYQYIKTLFQWLVNYRDQSDIIVYCEVEDDIKQFDYVNKSITWTQVKSYSSSFNLSGSELTKTLYNFFVLYLCYEEYKGKFIFETNSKPSGRDELLNEWINSQPLNEENVELLAKLVVKTQQILRDSANDNIRSTLSSILPKIETLEAKQPKSTAAKRRNAKELETLKAEYESVKKLGESFLKKLDDVEILLDFVKRIEWVFEKEDPDKALQSLKAETITLLGQIIPNKEQVALYFERLLTEIFFRSAEDNADSRTLDRELLEEIFRETEEELRGCIDREFIGKIEGLGVKIDEGFDEVKTQLNTLEHKIDFISEKITPQPEDSMIFPPTADEDEVKKILDSDPEKQSKLESKIKKIEFQDIENENKIIAIATEMRCNYLLLLQKLKLGNKHHQHSIVKNLEKIVQIRCTNAVIHNGEEGATQFNSRLFWKEFQDDLRLLAKEQSRMSKIEINETVVYGQMYQMAAECHLKWNNKG